MKQYRYVNLIRRPDTIQYVFYRLLVIISSTKKLIGHKAKLPQQWTDFFSFTGWINSELVEPITNIIAVHETCVEYI